MLKLINSFKVGHDDIDDDHAEILNAIKAIINTAKTGGDLSVARSSLDQFVHTCEQHFQNEERILAEAGYPHLAAHRDDHKEMLTKIQSARDGCINADNHDVCIQNLQDIIGMMIDDIVRSDMTFISYLQTQGVVRNRL